MARFKWFSLKKGNGVPAAGVIPTGGRSSVEESPSLLSGLANYLRYWDGIEPILPPSYLDQISRIALVNPDMSQAVSNWVALGNPGHDLIIVGADVTVEQAMRRLNAKARNLVRHSAGIDGLVNKYLEQVAITGAISSEDVVMLGTDAGVREVVLVPVSQIRFRREHGEYVPYQLAGKKEVRLNPVTYRYLAHATIENSPYAKPPMVAALEPILDQRQMKKNLQFILKKFGLFGLISASVTPPRQEAGEALAEYRERVQEYLKSVLNAFRENFHEGMAVFTDDIKVERTNLTTDARGIQELYRINEEQVFSGMSTDPAMHGRTYSTTETYARVVYNLLTRQADAFQRPVKRRIERTYQLDLALAGLEVDDLYLRFREPKSRDPLTEARARQVNWQVARQKVAAGLLAPDAAARELGYERWFNEDRLSPAADLRDFSLKRKPLHERLFRFRYDGRAQRYTHQRPAVRLRSRHRRLPDEEIPQAVVGRRTFMNSNGQWHGKEASLENPII